MPQSDDEQKGILNWQDMTDARLTPDILERMGKLIDQATLPGAFFTDAMLRALKLDMSDKQDSSQFSSLFAENNIDLPSVIMHPHWRNMVERSRSLTVDADLSGEPPKLLGMEVQYSSFVEEGQVYLVSQPRRFGFSNLRDIPVEVHQRMQASLERYIRNALLYGDKPETQWQQSRTYNWHRFPDETLLDWGERLGTKGLLDNPDIRWEYQVFVLTIPIRWVKALLKRG
jgi:hypothetical protein